MKRKLMLVLGGAVAGLAAYGVACNVAQPLPGCPVAGGDSWVLKYTLTSGSGACAQLKGEVAGFEKYRPPGEVDGLVAIRTLGIAEPAEAGQVDASDVEGKKRNAFAKIPGAVDENNFCQLSEFVRAEQSYGAKAANPDAGTAALPATDIAYEWLDAKILVTPDSPGTQMMGTLRYTKDGCSATYEVVGMWPAVACGVKDPTDPAGKRKIPDDSLCEAERDLEAGRLSGSGINPSFPVQCDPDLLMCVLTRTPPAFK